MKKKILILILASFLSLNLCTSASAVWVLEESCGVLDGWHQTTEIVDGYKYVVDYFNCANTATDSGDMCSNHPCLACSSVYCAEGSEKYVWVDELKNFGPPDDPQCNN